MNDATAPRPRILARADARGVVVEVEDRLYLRLDAAGRWIAFGEGGALFRRAVDGRVLRPRRAGFETLTEAETEAVDLHVVRRAGEVAEALADADASDLEIAGDGTALRAALARAACGAAERPAESRRRYAAAYPEAVPILPPHRYRDLVVLPATGCPNHQCVFCAFYRDRPFRVLDDAAFDAHLGAVRDLFAEALVDRDGIFLGSASALTIPDDVLVRRLRAVRAAFGAPRRGIASFHDPDRGRRRSPADWARLVQEGLVEATLGLETGLPALRRAQGKSADVARVVGTAADQKAGGLTLSVTVLVGLGGASQADAHRVATVEALARMPLTPADRVYLSPLAGGQAPRTEEGELARWREALAACSPARVGDYRVERFAWFA
jgi:radical SAM superfamily enzyme YgiQ (UPF0313 family)